EWSVAVTTNAGQKTLDQLRAAHAWQATEHVDKAFGRQAKRLGPRILTSGLGPSVQFLIAKNEAPKLAETLQAWLLDSGPTKTPQRGSVDSPSRAGSGLIAD